MHTTLRSRRGLIPALIPFGLLLAGSACTPDPTPPPVVTPSRSVGGPPSDAVVLYSGGDLAAWSDMKGGPAPWMSEDGVMIVRPRSGNLRTRETFGDCQIHLEFKMPSPAKGQGQDRGNSGVYVQARYEVQVLDSYESETYPDGQCGAIYKKHPPLVNASLPPGEWQTYDIIFRAARFDDSGKKTADAMLTVFHNGVLIQDHAKVDAPTGASGHDENPSPGPIMLQDHDHPVAYRNIWVRRL